jgi:GxxExxY protein
MDPKAKLLYPKLSYRVQGCFFYVYNTLGFGHKESVYQRALAKEFKDQSIVYKTECKIPISYKNHPVGYYQPDFVVSDKIIIEVKALEQLPNRVLAQLVYYLKGTNFKLGFLVNFGASKLQIFRRIWSPEYKAKARSVIREN